MIAGLPHDIAVRVRVRGNVIRHLHAAAPHGLLAGRLRGAIWSEHRPVFDEVLAELVGAGVVQAQRTPGGGTRYRLPLTRYGLRWCHRCRVRPPLNGERWCAVCRRFAGHRAGHTEARATAGQGISDANKPTDVRQKGSRL